MVFVDLTRILELYWYRFYFEKIFKGSRVYFIVEDKLVNKGRGRRSKKSFCEIGRGRRLSIVDFVL